MSCHIFIVIPTLNPNFLIEQLISSLEKQSLEDIGIINIDSGSFDQEFITKISELKSALIKFQIQKNDFNHGLTRNLGATLASKDCEILVYMTQDAVLNDNFSLENLIQPFLDPNVAAVCGRQIPHDDANAIASHARFFNYPAESSVKSIKDIPKLGIKTAFMSNSFAAYRKSVFDELRGFPSNTILAEDMYLTAKMILAGYKVVYAADAIVKHSHNYTIAEEFRRYFDIGVFHRMEPWIIDTFGKAEGEGQKFVISEFKYLINNKPTLIPKAVIQTFAKYFGYKLGTKYQKLPLKWCKRFSMTKSFWK